MKLYNKREYIDAHELFENKELLGKYKVTPSYDRKHYSASFLKGWSQCPASLILGIFEEGESPALIIGNEVHRLLEEHYKEGLTPEQTLAKVNDNKNIEFFHSCKVKEYLQSYFSIEEYKKLTNVVYRTEEEIITKASPLGIELPVKMKSFIDRVDISDQGIFIIDYKTASRAPSDDQYIGQMMIYKWVLEEEWGVPVEDVYIASIYNPDPKYIKQDITLRKQSELIDKIFNIDKEVEESINKRCYNKKEGYWCKWCPLYGVCKDPSVIEI